MFQNLKVDIVYYNTNTDFEMEFNLCGCCRMRLLTDKAPNRKIALHSLARAVARSRIIIVIGGLFGEEGTIRMVAGALGTTVEEIDTKTYGISVGDKLEILKGATPLVSTDGFFGGCIIESGPQTMILLSENKSIRKSVMSNLIHPYIEQLCASELKERAEAASDDQSGSFDLDESEEISPEVEVESELVTDTGEDIIADALQSDINEQELVFNGEYGNSDAIEAESDAILSSGMIFESDDVEISATAESEEEIPLITDSETIDISSGRAEIAEKEADDYLFEDEEYPVMSPGERTMNISIVIITIIAFLVLALLAYTMFYVPLKDGINPMSYIGEIFSTLFG